jgi:4-hydroxythreonine-4-phosphate dehydrogenase
MSIRIGITCGDINGIGPEIALKAVSSTHWKNDVEFTFIGPETLPILGNSSELFSNAWEIEGVTAQPSSNHWKENCAPPPSVPTIGKITVEASRTAVTAIERGVQGCLAGEIDAMVTAPICKEGLQRANIPWPGHTEMIAAMTGCKRYGMMLMGKGLRVMLATRHLPLREVADALTKENILETIELTGEALEQLGLSNGRIGVCGLNPHAGDGGVLGSEEVDMIAPAIEAAKANGLNLSGPVPADTIFFQCLENYDAIVAMYHDQGLGPLKMHAFDCGVNWTVGLPIIRTSPDHGTAFNIAGQDKADPRSMIAAIETAIQLVKK